MAEVQNVSKPDMFRSNMFNDPFFVNRPSPFMGPLMGDNFFQPMLPFGQQPSRARQANNNELLPFGMLGGFDSLFGNMNSMMANMEQQMNSAMNDPNSQMYSQSTVMSFSNFDGGKPKVYQASTSTRQGPGGVRETRKIEHNSETGEHKMAVGHHIGDRGHVIEKRRNKLTGDEEEEHEYVNIEEDEASDFNDEFKRHMAHSRQRRVGDGRRHRPADRLALTGPGAHGPHGAHGLGAHAHSSHGSHAHGVHGLGHSSHKKSRKK